MAHIYSISQLWELAHSPLVVVPPAAAQIDHSLFQSAPRAQHHHQKDGHKHRGKERGEGRGEGREHRGEGRHDRQQWKKPQWEDVTGMELASSAAQPASALPEQPAPPRKQVDLWEGDISYQTKKDGSSRFSSLFGAPQPQQAPMGGALNQPLGTPLASSGQPSSQPLGQPTQSPLATGAAGPSQARSPLEMDSLKGYLSQRMYAPQSSIASPGQVHGQLPGQLGAQSTQGMPIMRPPGMSGAAPGMSGGAPGMASPPGFLAKPGFPQAQSASGLQGAPHSGMQGGLQGAPHSGLQGGQQPQTPTPKMASSSDLAFFNSLLSRSEGSPKPAPQSQVPQAAQAPYAQPHGQPRGTPHGTPLGQPHQPHGLYSQPSAPGAPSGPPGQPHPYAFYGKPSRQLYGGYVPPPPGVQWPQAQPQAQAQPQDQSHK